MNKAYLLDRGAFKDIPLLQLHTSEWWLDRQGRLGNISQADAYNKVSWVYRAVSLRAQAISAMPFTLRKGDVDVEWPLSNTLSPLLYLTEAALCILGCAYWFRERNTRKLLNLRWLAPTTMLPVYDKTTGLVGFKRQVNNTEIRLDLADVVYFWQPAWETEMGPGTPPVSVALSAAGQADYMSEFASEFFRRGAIPAVLLTVDGNPPPAEIERLETRWKRMLQGVKKTWETFAVRAAVKVQVLGQPVKDLAMPELEASVRQRIAVALGIPQTLLEDAANFATAKEHRLSFYRETIIPESGLIAAALNAQVFTPLGLTFEFHPEQVEALQQDEGEKSAALRDLVNAGILTVNEAREQLGYEPIEEAQAEITETPTDEQLTEPAIEDIRRWRRKSKARGAVAEFESKSIPESVQAAIRECGFDWFARYEAIKAKREPDRVMERKLRKRIETILSTNGQNWVDDVRAGRSPDLTDAMAQLRSELLTTLSSAAVEETLAQAVANRIDFDVVEINSAALEWARKYSYELVKGIEETTRNLIANAVTTFTSTPGMTNEQLVQILQPAYGEARANMIAITEVTRAYAQGTSIYQEMLDAAGVKMVRVWNTSADERVCDICEPLNGKPETEWQDFGAPPGHVNCRCFLTLEYQQ
jgi:HK97 family phage portal protein